MNHSGTCERFLDLQESRESLIVHMKNRFWEFGLTYWEMNMFPALFRFYSLSCFTFPIDSMCVFCNSPKGNCNWSCTQLLNTWLINFTLHLIAHLHHHCTGHFQIVIISLYASILCCAVCLCKLVYTCSLGTVERLVCDTLTLISIRPVNTVNIQVVCYMWEGTPGIQIPVSLSTLMYHNTIIKICAFDRDFSCKVCSECADIIVTTEVSKNNGPNHWIFWS